MGFQNVAKRGLIEPLQSGGHVSLKPKRVTAIL
jgi:hypothetical protein